MFRRSNGFTIIEIIVVIIVIGILASIGFVSFRGSPERAEFARALSDLKHMNDAITVYKSQKQTYPPGDGSCQDAKTALGSALVPTYLDIMPVPPANKSNFDYKYCADANGTDYKLLRSVSGGLPDTEKNSVTTSTGSTTAPALSTTGTDANSSWGYWTSGAASF